MFHSLDTSSVLRVNLQEPWADNCYSYGSYAVVKYGRQLNSQTLNSLITLKDNFYIFVAYPVVNFPLIGPLKFPLMVPLRVGL